MPTKTALACGGRRGSTSVLAALSISLSIFGGVAGCVFTDPINMPPEVEIQAPAQIWRGDSPTFTANLSDPNGDRVDLQWTHVRKGDPLHSYACPTSSNVYRDPSRWPTTAMAPMESYMVPSADTDGMFCVWAFARDRHGALQVAKPLEVVPANHAPSAVLQVGTLDKPPECATPSMSGPIDRFATIVFRPDCSHDLDGDDVEQFRFSWKLTGVPKNSTAELTDCPGAGDPRLRCLMPDGEGMYEVELTVDDDHGGVVAVRRLVEVAGDSFPCLREVAVDMRVSDPTTGLVLSRMAGDPVHFEVNIVEDDGEPYPTAGGDPPTFYWFRADGDDPLVSVGDRTMFTFYDEPAHAVGDVVRVRAEVRDRQVDAIGIGLAACGPDAAVCAIGDPTMGCLQRVTWTIRYNL